MTHIYSFKKKKKQLVLPWACEILASQLVIEPGSGVPTAKLLENYSDSYLFWLLKRCEYVVSFFDTSLNETSKRQGLIDWLIDQRKIAAIPIPWRL